MRNTFHIGDVKYNFILDGLYIYIYILNQNMNMDVFLNMQT